MWRPFLLILLVILIGIIGFHIIEGLSFLDSLYMTIITIFTVGFREVKELSSAGQVFTILIILGGVGTVLFAFTKIAEKVFEGTIHQLWRRKKMEKKIQNLKDHYIICGFGRMGKTVKERLEGEKLPFVIIDNNEEKLEELKGDDDTLFIEDDATQEEVLVRAGIKKAKGLAALLPNDADNLYLVLTVRLINPSIFVLSKALDEEGEKKILQIGANKVVSPYKLGGLKIAQGLIRPTLVDFVDLIIRRKELALHMEEFIVKKSSQMVNRNLAECDIRRQANVIVVAMKKPGEDIAFNPSSDAMIETGDILLVLGDKEAINKFQNVYL
ncbi:MAG: potassium channel protein [Candidatus Aminicenantes bacterium]|nr:MAG: potassium channel protein [Candidatus Aminicenantes bacterium]